jgi:hypothetical protein
MRDTMTAGEMNSLLGAEGTYAVKEMRFAVRITDVKDAGWNRVNYQIEPIEGEGSSWVLSTSVVITARGE